MAEVAVFLCTHNGARHLKDQLDSVAGQQRVDLSLWVSDDNSEDATLGLLNSWRDSNPDFACTVVAGPGKGHAANFLSLACDPTIQSEYYAYCDQDDLWDSDKLSRAVDKLSLVPDNVPALYCGRTRAISAGGDIIGASPLFSRTPGFANALIQNIAGGNTMVLNRRARDLLVSAGYVDVVAHDWWTYLLVSGAGGQVIYDPDPSVSYRQHRDNLVGANTGPKKRILRYRGFLQDRNRRWNARNVAALETCRPLLTHDSRALLTAFSELRSASLRKRLYALRKGGFYAQTMTGNFGLWVASLLKKI